MTKEIKISKLNMSQDEKKSLYTFLKRQDVEFTNGYCYRKHAIEAIENHLKNATKISEQRRKSLNKILFFMTTGKDPKKEKKARGQEAKEWIDNYFKEKKKKENKCSK